MFVRRANINFLEHNVRATSKSGPVSPPTTLYDEVLYFLGLDGSCDWSRVRSNNYLAVVPLNRWTCAEMGASQSTPDKQPKVFHTEPPIEVCRFSFTGPGVADDLDAKMSPDVVNNLCGPRRPSNFKSTVLILIYGKEYSANEQLCAPGEETVQLEIHRVLKKENLDREMRMVGLCSTSTDTHG